ncbi:hypothetical protein B0A48_09119 [Cryoendolithus antarcticus]|uniref:Mitochondrial import inner membrane translocase subunit Tim21 n=1 Tax=Cryoendolithus antarcticus TaxID=1507870 RepID=A0A1V8T266_9PEZI|nr:hypothetical protein B0A48_09119 [Cryoendolithus antarcticus]
MAIKLSGPSNPSLHLIPRPSRAFHPPRLTRPATTSSLASKPSTTRKSTVSVFSDDGRVPWNSLTNSGKIARATQQSFNFSLIFIGLGATIGVFTVLYLEVFSPSSKTAIFNRCADKIRKDAKCLELLCGPGLHGKREVEAFGEPSWSRWARNRRIASRVEVDRAGVEHMKMHFYVKGKEAEGTVQVHMSKVKGGEWEYEVLALDVSGQQRVWVEKRGGVREEVKRQGKLFGVRWN